MDNEQQPQETLDPAPLPEAPAAPSTTPGALHGEAAHLSMWPLVLGVIAIILGILGGTEAGVQLMRGWAGVTSVSILNLLSALLLFAAGIGLFTRQRWGLLTARVWAVAKMLRVVFTIGMAWHMQAATIHSTPASTADGASFMGLSQGMTLVLQLVWGSALPLFVLVWLSQPKIKDETAGWQ